MQPCKEFAITARFLMNTSEVPGRVNADNTRYQNYFKQKWCSPIALQHWRTVIRISAWNLLQIPEN